jgi:outer membrane protein assembly factor BamA
MNVLKPHTLLAAVMTLPCAVPFRAQESRGKVVSQECMNVQRIDLKGNLGRPATEIRQYCEVYVEHPDTLERLEHGLQQAVLLDLQRFGYAFAKVSVKLEDSGNAKAGCHNASAILTIDSDKQYRIGDIHVVDANLQPSDILTKEEVQKLLPAGELFPGPEKLASVQRQLGEMAKSRSKRNDSVFLQFKRDQARAMADIYVQIQ